MNFILVKGFELLSMFLVLNNLFIQLFLCFLALLKEIQEFLYLLAFLFQLFLIP